MSLPTWRVIVSDLLSFCLLSSEGVNVLRLFRSKRLRTDSLGIQETFSIWTLIFVEKRRFSVISESRLQLSFLKYFDRVAGQTRWPRYLSAFYSSYWSRGICCSGICCIPDTIAINAPCSKNLMYDAPLVKDIA